jgi:ubiquinone/menaquinone biosynthesis C-methylase UbiE
MSDRAAEHADFKTFEHEGWEIVARPYRDAFGTLTAQTIPAMLEAAEVDFGTRLLDVATGPGDLAAEAAERGAEVIGVDFAEAMVGQAKEAHPGVEYRVGDAEALPFEAGRFDAVTINFGMLHFAAPLRAIAEAHRVLVPGGRLVFTAWSPPERSEGLAIVMGSIEKHGRTDVPLPEGPPFFRFAERLEVERALIDAGFRGVNMRELPLLWKLAAAEAPYDAFWEGGVRTRGLLMAQTPEARTTIRAAIAALVREKAGNGPIELPMPAVMTAAVRG